MLTCNARSVVAIQTEEYGEVLFVAIGAREVGTVKCVPPFFSPTGPT